MGLNLNNKTKYMADINVTPLVDVMLVLLIVFMVTAPMLTIGVPVDLPEAQARPLPDDTNATFCTTSADDFSRTVVAQCTVCPKSINTNHAIAKNAIHTASQVGRK